MIALHRIQKNPDIVEVFRVVITRNLGFLRGDFPTATTNKEFGFFTWGFSYRHNKQGIWVFYVGIFLPPLTTV